MSVRLLVVDHQPHERNQLELRLRAEPGIELVAQWLNSSNTENMVEQHRPDVLLLDLDLPADHAFDTLNRVAAVAPRTRTLGTCARVTDALIFRVFEIGGHGVIAKRSPHVILVDSIRAVADGRYWVAPEHAPVLIEALHVRTASQPTNAGQDPRRFRLTPRELDIVAAVTMGASNKEIAHQLSVAECTVKHHLSSVYTKLGVFSRVQLALFAIHHHLVQVSESTQFLH